MKNELIELVVIIYRANSARITDAASRVHDRRGANRLSVKAVDGKPLPPGRYRLTAVALLHARQSRPISTTFAVGAPTSAGHR